jgi:hypothetical protein
MKSEEYYRFAYVIDMEKSWWDCYLYNIRRWERGLLQTSGRELFNVFIFSCKVSSFN